MKMSGKKVPAKPAAPKAEAAPKPASGNFWTSSWSTTNPTNTSYYDGGEEGWGRNHGQLPGLGFGGVSQNGAVRLRWWA